jgi:hypothetical protein
LDLAWLEWSQERHDREPRVPLMVPIDYEYFTSVPLSRSFPDTRSLERNAGGGTGMTANISNRGLCLLVDWKPAVGAVFRVAMPAKAEPTNIPTLAEVRWVRPIPLGLTGVCAVGMKFLV